MSENETPKEIVRDTIERTAESQGQLEDFVLQDKEINIDATNPENETPKTKLVALNIKVDQVELAVVIAEQLIGKPRPEGATAIEALQHLPEEHAKDFLRAAKAAAEYIASRIQAATVEALESIEALNKDETQCES